MNTLNILKFYLPFLMFLGPFTFAQAGEWDQARVQLEPLQTITVYRDANCQCCHKWIVHLEKHQFNVIDKISSNMTSVKKKLGVPPSMASCHTAIVENYVIEGHVPADDIKQVLLDKPDDIKGLAVPQMPVGTPGMEMGNRKDSFIVFSFDQNGQSHMFNVYETDAYNNYQSLKPVK